MKLSVVIPAHNEEGSIKETVERISQALNFNQIDHEILVVNDHSTDRTESLLKEICQRITNVRCLNNAGPGGYGRAVRLGLDTFSGGCVAVMMGDSSDDPSDLVNYYAAMQETGVDCVFGSRFIEGSHIKDYPKLKLILNRFANLLVKLVFRLDYNDCTNAFKLYRRETINGIRPFLSPHYNLTLEMPLKAIVRGFSYTVLPNSWTNRRAGTSKLKIKEMGSRYFFIFLYCLIEKYFSKGDFNKEKDARRKSIGYVQPKVKQ